MQGPGPFISMFVKRHWEKGDRREDRARHELEEWRAKHQLNWEEAHRVMSDCKEFAYLLVNEDKLKTTVLRKFDIPKRWLQLGTILHTAEKEWPTKPVAIRDLHTNLTLIRNLAKPLLARQASMTKAQRRAAERILDCAPAARREIDRQWRELPKSDDDVIGKKSRRPGRRRRRDRDSEPATPLLVGAPSCSRG